MRSCAAMDQRDKAVGNYLVKTVVAIVPNRVLVHLMLGDAARATLWATRSETGN